MSIRKLIRGRLAVLATHLRDGIAIRAEAAPVRTNSPSPDTCRRIPRELVRTGAILAVPHTSMVAKFRW